MLLTPSLPWCHLKTTNKMRNLKPLSFFVFFFARAYERLFIKTHSIQSECVNGPENILFAGASVYLSARKFYRLGSEGVNIKQPFCSGRGLKLEQEDTVRDKHNTPLVSQTVNSGESQAVCIFVASSLPLSSSLSECLRAGGFEVCCFNGFQTKSLFST